MTHMRTTPVLLLALVFMWTLSPGRSLVVAAGQDSLARAKDLYSSAAYDEALAMLDGLQAGSSAGASASAAEDSGRIAAEVWLYQAFCLLALGRTDEAKKVIERTQRDRAQGGWRADGVWRLRRRGTPQTDFVDGSVHRQLERRHADVPAVDEHHVAVVA